MTVEALFEPDGAATYVPTEFASGPWHPGVLHGGAVNALLTGLLEDPDRVMTRVLIDLVAPVPSAPLTATVGPIEGGRRVVRQSVVLEAGGKAVARASALRMRKDDLDLPAAATDQPAVFGTDDLPDLTKPNELAVKTVGRESFDSLSMATRWEDAPPDASGRRRMWLKLLVPVVPDRPPTALENVAASADYGTGGTSARLPMRSWSFMNADLVVSLSRPPVGDWVGLHCTGILSTSGTGQSAAMIHDADGLLGQSCQSILIEPRT